MCAATQGPSPEAGAESFASLDAAIAALDAGAAPAKQPESPLASGGGRQGHVDSRGVARRVEAANRLARCQGGRECARAARALERNLFDPEATIRRAVLNTLVAIDARSAGGSIVRLLGVEREVSVLPAALVALGKLRVEGANRILVERAAHPHPAVRAAALTAAGDLGGSENRRLVLNSFQMAGDEDADWFVRASAMLALARIGRASDLGLIDRVYRSEGGHESWLARSAMARLVAALHPRPQRTLEALLRDSDMRVAVTAATGMASAGLVDVLELYSRSDVPQIRAATIGGVRQAKLARLVPRVRHMARWDRDRQVRWAAAVALFALEDPLGDELMIEALKSQEIAVWMGALAHLARRTGASHGRSTKAWSAELKRWRRG